MVLAEVMCPCFSIPWFSPSSPLLSLAMAVKSSSQEVNRAGEESGVKRLKREVDESERFGLSHASLVVGCGGATK